MKYLPQTLSVLGLLAVILLVLLGAYLFTRWASQSLGTGGLFAAPKGGSRLRVLDRALIGRDQALLVVKAGQRYLLMGSGPGGLTLLAELSREEGENWEAPVSPEGPELRRPPDFRALIQRLKEKK